MQLLVDAAIYVCPEAQQKHPCHSWHPSEADSWACRMAWWLGVPAALLLGTGVMWGPLAAAMGLTQALLAIIVLEDVNYIEHYGLQRALTMTGRRETALCACSMCIAVAKCVNACVQKMNLRVQASDQPGVAGRDVT